MKPLGRFQRLDLGQFFPTLFPAAPKDFPPACGFGPGKKAVLVATFSFGRLVCSFHEAWIIVKFFCNIQRFVLRGQKSCWSFPSRLCSLIIFLPMDKKVFCCTMMPLSYYVRPFFSGADVYFGLFCAVENMLISYLLIFDNSCALEYII